MTIESAKETFLFDFIKLEMIERKSPDLSQEVINAEENLSKLRQATYNLIKNGK